jgi:hypothetical protein
MNAPRFHCRNSRCVQVVPYISVVQVGEPLPFNPDNMPQAETAYSTPGQTLTGSPFDKTDTWAEYALARVDDIFNAARRVRTRVHTRMHRFCVYSHRCGQ